MTTDKSFLYSIIRSTCTIIVNTHIFKLKLPVIMKNNICIKIKNCDIF